MCHEVSIRNSQRKKSDGDGTFRCRCSFDFLGTINLLVYIAWLNWLMTLLSLSGIIYIALGFLAFRSPLLAAIFGFTLYAAFLVFESVLGVNRGVNLLMEGLGFTIPIIILLLVAVVSPLKCSVPYKVGITTLAVTLITTLGFLVHVLWLNSLWKAEVSGQAVYEGSEQARQDFQKKGNFACLNFMARTQKTLFQVNDKGNSKSDMQNIIRQFMFSELLKRSGLKPTTSL